MIIQFCGLSGSGKTTLAQMAREHFSRAGIALEVIDADEYRMFLNQDIGFSIQDRHSNIRRLAFIAGKFAQYPIIPIICAINPFEEIRKEIRTRYDNVKTIYIKCSLDELARRDTKGLYQRALLPEEHPEKIRNLTGVNHPFEVPTEPDLVIETDQESPGQSASKLIGFIEQNLQKASCSNS